MHGTLTFVLIPSQQIKPPPAKETVVSDFFMSHYLFSGGYCLLFYLIDKLFFFRVLYVHSKIEHQVQSSHISLAPTRT